MTHIRIMALGLRALAIGGFALTLAGCATANADREFSFEKNKGMGMLVGSLTSNDPGNFFSQDVDVYFTPADDVKASRVHLTTNDHCFINDPDDTDFKDQCGKLFAVVVPAGEYSLDQWYIKDAGGGVILPQQWQPVKVTVRAGKVTYVGNIHMWFDASIQGGGPDGWHGWPVASDKHERDIPVLLSQYPALKEAEVVMELLTLPPPSRVCNRGSALVVHFTVC